MPHKHLPSILNLFSSRTIRKKDEENGGKNEGRKDNFPSLLYAEKE